MSRYLALSRSPYYSLLAALPLLVAYELLLFAAGGPAQGQVRNAADVWVRIVLASLDLSPRQGTAAMILMLLIAIPFLRRGQSLESRYFGYMLLETLLYGLALRFLIDFILVFLFSLLRLHPAGLTWAQSGGPAGLPLALPPGTTLGQAVALSLGAGLFEEFVFRVLLVNALLLATRMVLAEWLAATVSVMGAAFLFAAAHYVGAYAEPLALHSFAFRWLAGLLFTLIYYRRGFAIAAYSHAFYDIWLLVW
jgi:membrane protease YdiL (CAAX protease family)